MGSIIDELLNYLINRPWLILVLMALPFIKLGIVLRAFPHARLVIALAVPALLSFGVFVHSSVIWPILCLDLVILLVATLDLFTLPHRSAFSAQRQTPHIASLGQHHRVTLTVNNHSNWTRTLTVRDDTPHEFESTVEEFHVRLHTKSRAVMHYDAKPHRRGAFHPEFVYLRAGSLLGLWRRYFRLPFPSEIFVYPDMKQLSEYAALARTNRLSLMGVRRTRKIGQDNEFERLRDYTLDDNYKHIDWRTTARRHKLTVKDFQTNQSQRIIFLLDCGRMMTNVVPNAEGSAQGLSLLDHSLNAMLMMSYVALRQGDQVGMISFSDTIHNFVPPRGGLKQMNQLLHASFNRFPELVESRYEQAFLHLSHQCRKRSLVVLITNVIDEVNAHQIQEYLTVLVGRHLPLGVLLRDHRIFEAADSPPSRREGMIWRAAVAAEILTWRHQVLRDLEHQGVLMLDLAPEDMTAPLVNRYLEIKARHLL